MPISKKSEDERLQSWMEWYDRQLQKREQVVRQSLPPKAFERLTREEVRSIFRQRLHDGWAAPTRRRHQATQGYHKIIISLLIQRDGRTCGICKEDIEVGQESIDHIEQKSAGGLDEAANIRLAHRTCNIRRPRELHPPMKRKEPLRMVSRS